MTLGSHQEDFIAMAIKEDAITFGDFTLKSGRKSPYFFNAGVFSTGDTLNRLALHYAHLLESSEVGFDVLFGPAYKGIPLAVATAVAYGTQYHREVPWCFNRKEAKDHGEKGSTVGAPLSGQRVVIVDDVITVGTALKESAALIKAAGATLVGVVILLDRQEPYTVEGGTDTRTVREVLQESIGAPILSVATFDDVVAYLGEHGKSDVAQRLADTRHPRA